MMRSYKSISLILFTLLGTAVLYSAFSHWAYDDPFITYRYAENLLHGLGFVYNPGERVLSTTTPLFALLLAGLGWFYPDLHSLANMLGVISIVVGGICVWILGRHWKSRWLAWTGLLLYPTFALLFNTLGSETPFYLMLCLAVIVFYEREAYNLAACMAALAVLVRADGVLLVGLLGLDFIIKRRKVLLRGNWRGLPITSLGLFCGFLALWFGFAWMYFGAPLPVTLAAKQAQGAMAISVRFAPGLMRIAGWYSHRWQYWVELALAIVGVTYAVRYQQRGILIVIWSLVYFVAYSVLGVSSYFWYYAPLVPGFIVATGYGIEASYKILCVLASQIKWVYQYLPALLLAVLLLAQVTHLNALRQNPDKRYPIYKAAGEWIYRNTPESVRVGALEVGIIGYYAQRPMIDFAGLIQPEVAAMMNTETTYEDTAMWAIARYQPDILVLFEHAFPKVKDRYINANCSVVKVLEKSKYNFSDSLFIYRCDW